MKNKDLVFKILAIVLIIGVLLLMVSLLKDEKQEEKLLGIDYTKSGNEMELNYKTDNPVVAMYIKNYGSVVIKLYPEYAPNTVNNFISLIKSRFYDDNTFHRLEPGFVLQGGDPKGNGAGGPGYSIKGEFSSNGFENNLKHKKGVISMARTDDPDSAGSQFFIMLDDSEYLDGNYAAFGEVIDGFDIIEKIEKNEKVYSEETGQLARNLIIEKTLVDLNKYEYKEPELITDSK